MTNKTTILLACMLMMSVPAMAQKAEPWEAIAAQLHRIAAETAPLQQYREQVYNIKNPSYETLLPSLRALTAYNQQFATSSDVAQKRQLAQEILRPTVTGWNNYRPIGLQEVFERYVPFKGQNDKEIGALEYFLKLHSVSKAQQNNMRMLQNMISITKDFTAQYQKFFHWMMETPAYDEKTIISHMVPMIKEYNKVRVEHPEMVKLIHESIFKQPVKAGWNRTHTIEDFRYYLGVEEQAGGDAFLYYSPKELQKYYGVTLEEAEIFSHFVGNYHKFEASGKPNALEQNQQANERLLNDMSYLVKDFLKEYNTFVRWAEQAPSFNEGEVLTQLVPVLNEYNKVCERHAEMAPLIRKGIFEKPFQAGWGNTRTIDDLRSDLGIAWYGGGDAYEYLSAKKLQEKYNLAADSAEVFAQFVRNYYK